VTQAQKGDGETMARDKHKKRSRPAKTESDKALITARKYERKHGGPYIPGVLSCFICHKTVREKRERGIPVRIRNDGKCVCAQHKDSYKVV